MKKYYIGLPFLLIGIFAAAIFAGIDLAYSGSIQINMILVVVLGVPFFAGRSFAPVKPWSVFAVDGSMLREERLFEKQETRQADLAADGMKLYKCQVGSILWLIASTEEIASMDAAKEYYQQKKAVMAPVNQLGGQMQELLESWADKAQNIG